MSEDIFELAGVQIAPGEVRRLEIPVAQLPTHTMLSIPVTVAHGVKPGAKLWLSAAIHGDEINGVETIREVLPQIDPQQLCGTLIAVPIVNVFGFIQQSRYLPDRRDLNRSFPGSATGSLASRIAHLFMEEIVSRSTHGIDLHTASDHRVNLPQIRANLEDAATHHFAKAFGAPLIMHSSTRDGSLRQAATKKGIPVLLYEAGEALRFDSEAIRIGVSGILRVMAALEMYPLPPELSSTTPLEAKRSKWLRASQSGILRLHVKLGEKIKKKQIIGTIADVFGDKSVKIKSSTKGFVIGHTQNPLVNQGDGIVNLAILE